MSDRRVSGWFVLSAIFVVMVFGLFFTFTERKMWPEHRIELGPMDMRVLPPVSTLWCEAVALHSEQPFVAYQVNHETRINPKHLNLQEVNLQIKLGGSWLTNSLKLKYFLLPSSVAEIIACASSAGVHLMLFKGGSDVKHCLQALVSKQKLYSDEYESEEDSSEDNDSESSNQFIISKNKIAVHKEECASLIGYHSVDLSYMEAPMECSPTTNLHPVKLNVSAADYYTIVIWNTNRRTTTIVNLQLLLDRSRYAVQRTGEPLDMCSLSPACLIGLGFASSDRVLVSIPDEPNSGRSTFVLRYRCKPRLALFAVLSILTPLLIFLAIAFLVRTDKNYINICCLLQRADNGSLPHRQRIATPLLNCRSSTTNNPPPPERLETVSLQTDEMPPPYYSLYESPPPYSGISKERKISYVH